MSSAKDADPAAKRKSVTVKRGWIDGVVIPTIVGCGVAVFILPPMYFHIFWYIFAAWQAIVGLGVLAELAPKYIRSEVSQAGRLAELVGMAWLVMAYQTAVAAWEVGQSKENSH